MLQILEIKSLIGYFDLEPNKVAALFLGIWQDQWDNEAYLRLLPLFSTQAISASLAFIFITYQVRHHVTAGTSCCKCTFSHLHKHGVIKRQQQVVSLAFVLSVMLLHGATGSGMPCFHVHVCFYRPWSLLMHPMRTYLCLSKPQWLVMHHIYVHVDSTCKEH